MIHLKSEVRTAESSDTGGSIAQCHLKKMTVKERIECSQKMAGLIVYRLLEQWCL
jgi:hypothetical protein